MSLNPYPNIGALHDPFPPQREEAIVPPTYGAMQQMQSHLQIGQFATFPGRVRGPSRPDDDRGIWRSQENGTLGGRERLDIPY